MPLQSIDPSTGKVLHSYAAHTSDEVEQALVRATEFATQARRTSPTERARLLGATGAALTARREPLARLMTSEMGKTLKSALSEVDKCAWVCRYYAEHGPRFLEDEVIASDATWSGVRPLPLGPILAVMPWNFPLWQVLRAAAPALMAGNTMLLKHASNVSGCALAIEQVFVDAGWPVGAFQTLLLPSSRVGELLSDRRIRGATLTGSEAAGAAVAETCGRHLKPVVLELGGSDPFLVLPSADLDAAVRAAVTSRTLNNGQSCIAAKRFIVHTDVYDAFAKAMVAAIEALTVGDPMQPTTDIGPLVDADAVAHLDTQVRATLEAGATRLTGARPLERAGCFYEPGVLSDIPKGSPGWTEEFFGPVALLFRVDDLDHGIRLANDSRFGLGSSVWTQDPAEAAHAVDALEAGATFVNQMVASDPRLPFGGIKDSGFGRELARDGLMAFVNRKTVSIDGFALTD